MCIVTAAVAGSAALATAANVSLAVSAIGVGLQTYSSFQEADARNDAAEYNARINEQNARTAELQAKNATERGQIEEKQHRLRVGQLKGTQRSSFAASGVLVDEGSAFDTLLDTTEFGELDALTIRHNAATEAWNFKNQSSAFKNQATLSRQKKTSPFLGAGATLLTGASKLSNSYFNFANRN